MPTSIARTFKHKKVNQKGFSLIEIMVAIVLIATILMSVTFTNPQSDRKKINEAIDNVDRAIRFASSEAVLRNSLVRIKFNLDSTPQEFSVEYANSNNLTIEKQKDLSKLSLLEREKEKEKQKSFNSQFTKASDFADAPIKVNPDIQIEGVATSYTGEVIREGEFGVYFYPTGERDNAAIFFSSFSEIGMLSIAAFAPDTQADFLPISQAEQDNYNGNRDRKIEELYRLWLKD